jgi:transcription antitermination factor NusG
MTKTWFAIYTSPRSEKTAHKALIDKGIEAYLPLVKTLRQWSDRKKWVEEPLFKSYLFVCIGKERYFDVLNTTGVVRYITFEGKAVPVPQNQIDAIRYYLESGDVEAEETTGLDQGTFVEVTRGQLMGLQGTIVEEKGRHRVKVEIEAIGQSIVITIPRVQLRRI